MDMSVMENGLKQFFIDGNLSFNGGVKTFSKKIIVKGVLSVKLISCRRFCIIGWRKPNFSSYLQNIVIKSSKKLNHQYYMELF